MSEAEDDFEIFVASRGAALRRTAYLLTGDWHLGEDLVQVALTKTYLRLARFREPLALEVYVRRVMVTTYLAWWRRRWRSEVPTASIPDHGAGDAEMDVDERQRLAQLLARLARQQRVVLVLRYYEDLTEAETARLLGCSIGSVKTHSSRALARLRALCPDADRDVATAFRLDREAT